MEAKTTLITCQMWVKGEECEGHCGLRHPSQQNSLARLLDNHSTNRSLLEKDVANGGSAPETKSGLQLINQDEEETSNCIADKTTLQNVQSAQHAPQSNLPDSTASESSEEEEKDLVWVEDRKKLPGASSQGKNIQGNVSASQYPPSVSLYASKELEMATQDPRKSMLCKYHAKGFCSSGEGCAFSHKRPLAEIHASTGQAVHSSQIECHYNAKGQCFRGQECLFLHSTPGNPRHVKQLPSLVSEATNAQNGVLHIAAKKHQTPGLVADARNLIACKYFLSGMCLKQQSCPFLHLALSEEPGRGCMAEANSLSSRSNVLQLCKQNGLSTQDERSEKKLKVSLENQVLAKTILQKHSTAESTIDKDVLIHKKWLKTSTQCSNNDL